MGKKMKMIWAGSTSMRRRVISELGKIMNLKWSSSTLRPRRMISGMRKSMKMIWIRSLSLRRRRRISGMVVNAMKLSRCRSLSKIWVLMSCHA
jgi:hypothetical protein